MRETSEHGLKRQPPDVATLIRVLSEAGVNYVVTGSAAAMLHGVPLAPGDLDITPALDGDNLRRLEAVLMSIEARQDPSAPFGHWQRGDDGERYWVKTAPTPEAFAARASWRPNPADPASFDYLLQSRHGALDVVPEVSGYLRRADSASRAPRHRRDLCPGRIGWRPARDADYPASRKGSPTC
jgi:hypothetical protein